MTMRPRAAAEIAQPSDRLAGAETLACADRDRTGLQVLVACVQVRSDLLDDLAAAEVAGLAYGRDVTNGAPKGDSG